MAPTTDHFAPPVRLEEITPERVAVEARRLWTTLDGKVTRELGPHPIAVLLALQFVLPRLLKKTRTTLINAGMTEAQLEEFERVNGLNGEN